MVNKKFIKDTFIYIFTEVINKAIPFLLLPLLTMFMDPSEFGTVATYMAYTSVIAILIHLNLVGAVRVNFFHYNKKNLSIYISNVLLIVITAAFIISLMIIILQIILIDKLGLSLFWLLLGVSVVFAQVFTSLNLTLWQVEGNPTYYGIYQILQMSIHIALVLIFVIVFDWGWKGQLFGQAIAMIIFGIGSIFFIYKRKYLCFKVNTNYIREALKFGVPLIPHAISGWFKVGVDRIFLTMIIGTTATGVYAVGYQLGMIIGVLGVAFNQAFAPFLFNKLTDINEDDKLKLVKYTYLYFILVLLIATIISYFSSFIVDYFLDIKFHNAAEILPWITFGYAFQAMYLMVVNYIFYIKRTLTLSIITFTVGVIHSLLSLFMIKEIGMIGAAYATTISFFITFIVVWRLSMKLYPMPWGEIFFRRKENEQY